jgi:hypothetical protein
MSFFLASIVIKEGKEEYYHAFFFDEWVYGKVPMTSAKVSSHTRILISSA